MSTSIARSSETARPGTSETKTLAAVVALAAAITALALVAGSSVGTTVEAPAAETTPPITTSHLLDFPLGGGGSVIFEN